MSVLNDIELPLVSATLSGGAQYVAAGAGLPNRITTQDDAFNTSFLVNSYGGIMLDPDGAHYWIDALGGAGPTKFDYSGTNTGISYANINIMGLFPWTGFFYASDYGGGAVHKVDYSTGASVGSSAIGGNPAQAVRANATTDLIWSFPLSATTITEYNFATGLPTGRTLAGTACWATPGFIYTIDGSSVINKYDEPTLTLQATWSLGSAGGTYPGDVFGGYFANIFVDSAGRPIVQTGLGHNIDRFKLTPGSPGSGEIDKRIVYAQPQLGGCTSLSSISDRYMQPAYCELGNYALFLSQDATRADSALCFARLKNLWGTQRARWSQAFPTAATINRIFVPGNLCNDKGSIYDLRKTRCYWSTNGGGTRTEFSPGDDLAVSVTAGGTLTVDVEFIEGNGQATNPPYVGSPTGVGPHVIYTTAGGGGGGGATPLVDGFSPSTGTTLASDQPLAFNVYDTDGALDLKVVIIFVDFGPGTLKQLVYDGSSFNYGWSGSANTVTSITNGFHFTILPDIGWPTGVPVRVDYRVVDAEGNAAV